MAFRLKFILEKCGVSLSDLARAIPKPGGKGPYAKSTLSICLSRGRFPTRDKDFKRKVERYLLRLRETDECLRRMKLDIKNIWDLVDENGRPLEAEKVPAGIDPETLNQEVEMLTAKAREAFSLKGDPFQDDIEGKEDIFLSDETRYMFMAMKEAALNQRFMAVIGEVGSGKTVAKKWLLDELEADESVLIIQPSALDKSRLTDASICDSIVYDLSKETPAQGPEKRTRQIMRLLKDRKREGLNVVLIVDEAQDLTPKALKIMKRLYEVEERYRKTLGIILIGQPELGTDLLNERSRPDLREVIRRCQVAWIQGLNGSLRDYIAHKFKRARVNWQQVLREDAVDAMKDLLTRGNGRKTVSYAYPLTVNNVVVRAMNEAARLGEKHVTAEIIYGLGRSHG